MLRALVARKFLQQRKFLRRRAAGKPVIHACRSENKMLKEQVAALSALHSEGINDRFIRSSRILAEIAAVVRKKTILCVLLLQVQSERRKPVPEKSNAGLVHAIASDRQKVGFCCRYSGR